MKSNNKILNPQKLDSLLQIRKNVGENLCWQNSSGETIYKTNTFIHLAKSSQVTE